VLDVSLFANPNSAGIPEVKAYLNGIDLPHILRFKTYVTKGLGVIFAQAAGLPLGTSHCRFKS
jgi:hypothetical protein